MSGRISNSLVVGSVPQENTTVKEQVYSVNTIKNNTSTSLNKTPKSICTLSFRCRLLSLLRRRCPHASAPRRVLQLLLLVLGTEVPQNLRKLLIEKRRLRRVMTGVHGWMT